MRDRIRTMALILATSFRADPLRTIGSVLLEGSGGLSPVILGLGLRAMTNGVLTNDVRLVLAGALSMVVVRALWLTAGGFGARMRLTLMERAGFAFEQRYAEVSASISSLTHHEHPEFRDKLELLRQNQQVLAGAANTAMNMLSWAVQAAGTLLVVARVHPMLLLLPLFGIPSVVSSALTQGWYRKAEEASAPHLRQAQHMYDLAAHRGAAKELRVFGLTREIRRRHDENWDASRRPVLRVYWRATVLGMGTTVALAAGIIGAVLFVALRAVHHLATPGDVVLTITIASQVSGVVSSAVGQLSWMLRALRNASRFRWLLDHAEAETSHELPGPPSRIRDGIAFRHLTFAYPGTERNVLDDVSLDLPAGSVVALVGENGAGKSTIVKLLCKFYEVPDGTLLVDGVDLGGIDTSRWREHVSAGFQDFSKLELVLRESVGVGDLPRIEEEAAVNLALERAGGVDVVESSPEGLATQLGRQWEHGVDLSVGQWQKLALGRAFMRDVPLLTILDEPTASLDAETEHALFERYTRDAHANRDRGAITVLVSHRFSTVRNADIIYVIDGGRVTERGSHDELMAADGLYATLYRLQARGYR